jgi:transcriptional regulator with XRE-family HTH domain
LPAQTRTKIAHQIRALRQQRGWSQGEFGERLGKPQSNVSRLETVDEGKYTLQTLLELASAFDVGLVVEFAPYEDFIRHTIDLSPSALWVDSFTELALEPLYTSSSLLPSAIKENAVLNWVAGMHPSPSCVYGLTPTGDFGTCVVGSTHMLNQSATWNVRIPGIDSGANRAVSLL